jgi:hypothetical protein
MSDLEFEAQLSLSGSGRSERHVDEARRTAIRDAVARLDSITVVELTIHMTVVPLANNRSER